MQERFLQFIWQHNLYKQADLITTSGEPLTIIHVGMPNSDAGPDFTAARIRIGNTMLAGNIELHVRTSDWYKHNHNSDIAYNNLILHVVYEHDMDEIPGNIPLLELGKYIAQSVIDEYAHLIHNTAPLPCGNSLQRVSTIIKESWLNRLMVERWEQKLHSWQQDFEYSGNDWRVLLYWRTAANFGFKVNAEAFLMLAKSIPLTLLGKQHKLSQIEALLFGQAGMLQGDFADEYPKMLQQEYIYLQHKYKLERVLLPPWKFLRLRPANFPTIRLAQFAMLVHQSIHLFAQIGEGKTLKELMAMLQVHASDYWDTHYRFDEPTTKKMVKKLGDDAAYNLIINTIAPVQFLYAQAKGNESAAEKALQLLEQIPAEDNKILRVWESYNWPPENAMQSQAQIQLYNTYCSVKRCLNCSIGLSLLKASRPNKEH